MFLSRNRHLLGISVSLMRLISSSVVCNKKHYDSLGLSPNATQVDIKSAYYKLSMQYHPDKNKGSEEAARIFRDITEAYEILGNLKLRKLYDKGILHTAGHQYAQREEDLEMEDDTQRKFYQSRDQRSRAPPPTGKTPIYNYDEWTQQHYGATFARNEAAKERLKTRIVYIKDHRDVLRFEVFVITLALSIVLSSFMYMHNKTYDIVEETVDDKSNKKPNSQSDNA